MVEVCPQCGLRFERLPGHSLGSVAINTTMSFSLMFAALAASLIATHPEFDIVTLLVVNTSVAILAPVLLFPTSKTLWTAIDLLARPPGSDEVKIEFLPGSPGR